MTSYGGGGKLGGLHAMGGILGAPTLWGYIGGPLKWGVVWELWSSLNKNWVEFRQLG